MLNRKYKPSLQGNISFKLPEIDKINLSNSLEIYFVEKKTLPIIQLILVIPSGSIYNNDKHGLSNLTSMLIDEGAGGLSSFEISDQIELLGSILNINSNKEFTTISLLSLKENFEKSMNLLSKIILDPSFKKIDFNRERERLSSQILQLQDNPGYLASNEIQKILFEGTPYKFPAIGTKESLDNITNENVKKFFVERYIPDGSYLIVVGDIDLNSTEKIINNYFGNWIERNKIKTRIKNQITNSKKLISIIDKKDAVQSEIRIGHLSKGRLSDDFYERTLLNSILGGQFSSRINLNLREDKGFTYGAHSNYNYNQLGSTFTISTSVKTENTADAVNEILKELELIKTNIKEEELEFSKSYLIRRYPSLFETYSQFANNISLLPIYQLELDYFNEYMNRIRKVSLEEVQKVAKENILIENLVLVIVGNKKEIEKEINFFAETNNFTFQL